MDRAADQPDEPAASDVAPIGADGSNDRSQVESDRGWAAAATFWLVFVGAMACLLRFLLRLPIWPDEAFLAINIARRDHAGLMAPLDYFQVAPPLYLLAVKSVVEVAGFHEWSLRVISLVALLLSLVIFRAIARRVLDPFPSVVAVGFLACSYWAVRYASEVKPYAFDLLLSVSTTWLAITWAAAPRGAARGWRLAALVLLALLGFGFSYPAVFVVGGVVVFMAWSVCRREPSRLWAAIMVGLALVAGFVAVWILHAAQQNDSQSSFMVQYWERAFPPGWRPDRLVWWFVNLATGELMPYPIGGRDFGSSVTAVFAVIGLAVLVRRGHSAWLVILAATLALALVAAALRRYPFGAPTRCQFYLAPFFALLAGQGLAWVLALGNVDMRRRVSIVCIVLFCIPIGAAVRDVVTGGKTPTDRTIRDLGRALWNESHAATPPTLSLRADLGASFSPERDGQQWLLASWLCNYHVYATPRPIDSIDLAAGVQVAAFRIRDRVDESLRAAWIESFASMHDLRYAGSVFLRIPDLNNHGVERGVDTVEVLSFVPSDGVGTGLEPAAETAPDAGSADSGD